MFVKKKKSFPKTCCPALVAHSLPPYSEWASEFVPGEVYLCVTCGGNMLRVEVGGSPPYYNKETTSICFGADSLDYP